MIGLLIIAAALPMVLLSDGPKKPKTQKVIYVYEHIMEDQPIPVIVTDSIVVKEELIP